MMCVSLKSDEGNIIHVILNTNDQLLNVQIWVLWPSHCSCVTSWLRTCRSWITGDEVIHCANNQSPVEKDLSSLWSVVLSSTCSINSNLTPCPGPGSHCFSLATLTCPTAQTAHPLDRHLEPSLPLAAPATGVQDKCNHHVKTHPTGEDA